MNSGPLEPYQTLDHLSQPAPIESEPDGVLQLRLPDLPGLLLGVELFVEEPHLVADHRNFPVLVLDLGLKVLAVLLLRVKPVQNLPVMVRKVVVIQSESYWVNRQ